MPEIPDSAITGFFLVLVAFVTQLPGLYSAWRTRKENSDQHGVTADELAKVVTSVNTLSTRVDSLGTIVVTQGLATLDAIQDTDRRLGEHVRDTARHL